MFFGNVFEVRKPFSTWFVFTATMLNKVEEASPVLFVESLIFLFEYATGSFERVTFIKPNLDFVG